MSHWPFPIFVIELDAEQCPRCASQRIELESDTDHVEFTCGSWVDRYSSEWWDPLCYERQGPAGLAEYTLQCALAWSTTPADQREHANEHLQRATDMFRASLTTA